MPSLSDYIREDYPALLGANVLDASRGVLYRKTGLMPDDTNRTIFIGLGGAGVQTIDAIKGEVTKRLDKSWKRCIGFLGIDADWTEFDGTAYLDRSEQIVITKENVAGRMSNTATFPAAVRRFMPKYPQGRWPYLQCAGAGCSRLQGKIKVHDCPAGGLGVDEEIVHALSDLVQNLDQIVDGQGNYLIYVIGSLCGGTGSGTITELPTLIRKAFNNSPRLSINAMLYLPDTMEAFDPDMPTRLYANGYASLKELNYYMGMFMRPEYPETWSYNGQADNYQLTYSSGIIEEGFFHNAYLIGTQNGPHPDAMPVSRETLTDFLFGIVLGVDSPVRMSIMQTAIANCGRVAGWVGNKQKDPTDLWKEAPGEFHEFPKRFAALGYARAALPEKLVRAYTVSRLCGMACIKPGESPVTDIKPWRGMDDLLSATEGTRTAEQLLRPLVQLQEWVHSQDFDVSQVHPFTANAWRQIRENDGRDIAMDALEVIQQKTDSKAMAELVERIKAAYGQFREKVHAYVREEGPFALRNLYCGRFTLVDGKPGRGIADMLTDLADGKNLDGRLFLRFRTPEETREALSRVHREIMESSPVSLLLPSRRAQQTARWVEAFNNWGNARIYEARRRFLFGPNGALREYVQMPGAMLARDIEAFGTLLGAMRDLYSGYEETMATYSNFCRDGSGATEVNLASMFVPGYAWLKDQADAAMDRAEPLKFRDALVDDFFGFNDQGIANSALWLDVPGKLVTKNPVTQKTALRGAGLAVPARQRFDRIVAEHFPDKLHISMEDFFVRLGEEGWSFANTAAYAVSRLYAQSKPLFNGDIPAGSIQGFLVIPSSLANGSPAGAEIAQALVTAARNLCPGVMDYFSDDCDSIRFYQFAGPMEVYRLKELKKWELHYERGSGGILDPGAGVHSMSPDIEVHTEIGWGTTYTEGIPWADYPPIAPDGTDPRIPDERGRISREGKYLHELDKTIARARELGVLYCEETPDGFVINRVFCNTITDTWNFDPAMCRPDPVTGLLPRGRAFAEAVAEHNGKTLDDISRRVRLEFGGLMDREYPTEDMAWQYAARVLRHHMPMYIEVKKTLGMFEEWAKSFWIIEEPIPRKFLPAKMVHLLRGGTLCRTEDGSWIYEDTKGVVHDLLVMDVKDYLDSRERYMIDNGLLYYYLFTLLDDILGHSVDAWDEALAYAKKRFNRLVLGANLLELEDGAVLTAKLFAEREALRAKGARLDGAVNVQPNTAFVKAMGDMFEADELTAIELFYYRTTLWERL